MIACSSRLYWLVGVAAWEEAALLLWKAGVDVFPGRNPGAP
jgi:hypothetical protein